MRAVFAAAPRPALLLQFELPALLILGVDPNDCGRRNGEPVCRAAPGFSGLNFANQPLPQVGRTSFAHDPPPRTVNHSSLLTQTSIQLIRPLLWPTWPTRKRQRLVGGDGIEPPTSCV